MRALGRVIEAVAVDGSANLVDGSADLVDGFELKRVGVSPRPMVRGDQTSAAIAAASIAAKETRDWLMRQLDVEYPGYGFALHKGYITPAHVAAVVDLGPSPAHRRSVRCKALAGRGNAHLTSHAKPATRKPTKTKKAPEWKSLPDPEKAQYLLDHQTLSDRTWTDERRLKARSATPSSVASCSVRSCTARPSSPTRPRPPSRRAPTHSRSLRIDEQQRIGEERGIGFRGMKLDREGAVRVSDYGPGTG